ncbi:MAG TPA: anti-sigma factor [Sphingomonas sp.]|nr:anti-sigma factor [Sphingomonas sp.]
MTIDAATRAAYVDGELDEIARKRVERAMAADPALAEAVERDRRLRDALRARFAPYAEQPVPDRLRDILEPAAVPIETARRRSRKAGRWWTQAAAIAATLVFGIVVGQQIETGPVATRDGALVAHGKLARALDTQLAATQPAEAAVRVGLTFRAQDGHVCRTFTSESLQGIACRGGGAWRLVDTAAGERTTPYRQASSGDAGIMAATQAMMTGAPFDRTAEAAARDHGWQ